MTQYGYHEDFVADVEKRLQEFSDAIYRGMQDVCDRFNQWVQDQWWTWVPWVHDHLVQLKNDLEAKLRELWDEFADACRRIWEKVEDLNGRPFELMELNQAYVDAAAALRDEKVVLARLRTSVEAHWSGLAFTAYANLIREQTAATAGVDAGLTSAATACAQGAKQINDIWNDTVDAILSYAGSVVDAIKDGANIGQAFTFEMGPALKVILDAVLAVADLALQLEGYWADNATVKTDMWRRLNSGLDGLDANNDWPRLATYAGDLDDQSSWTPA